MCKKNFGENYYMEKKKKWREKLNLKKKMNIMKQNSHHTSHHPQVLEKKKSVYMLDDKDIYYK